MSDRQISIRRLIRLLDERRVRGAVKSIEAGGTYEAFLIQSGKFRENRSLIQYLEALIESRGDDAANRAEDSEPEEEPEFEDIDPDEEDEEEAPEPTPRLVRAMKRSKPRAWGG